MILNVGNVESFLDDFVINEIGGVRVDESLNEAVDFKNADYKIDYMKKIIELKSLEENQAENKNFLDRLAKCHKPQLDYLCSEAAKKRNPEDLVEETMARYKRDIERAAYPRLNKILGKANLQIRETKKELSIENYSGSVWIINENNLYLSVENQINVVRRILSSDYYSSIESVILSNLNMQIASGSNGVPSLYWIPIFRSTVTEEIWNSVNFLGHCWQTYIRRRFNIPEGAEHFSGVRDVTEFEYYRNLKITNTQQSN